MDNFNVYKDIQARTKGEVYIGVVGPVRTGKSTFIKRFMDLMVLPGMEDEHDKARTRDELPQSAAGKTIMTTEPKFIPKEAAKVTIGDDTQVSIRLIDCVGYMVDGATGHVENDEERMVKTPWFDYEVPFSQAAEIGTKKVINDHSTIGIVITADGSFGEIPRENYMAPEEKTIRELKALGKPFIVLLNSERPYSDDTAQTAAQMAQQYGVTVMPVNCAQLKKEDIHRIMEEVLYEFPVVEMDFHIPKWVEILPDSHWLKEQMVSAVKTIISRITYIKDVISENLSLDNDNINAIQIQRKDLSNGTVSVSVVMKPTLYYDTISEYTGMPISGEYQLMKTIREFARQKDEYQKVKNALDAVRFKGYGVVMPDKAEISLDEPEVIKHGNKFGVKMKAEAPAINLIKSNIETEIAPIVGDERQAEDLIAYIKENAKSGEEGIWSTNIFGKSIEQIVEDGIQAKISQMTDECQQKLQDTLQKIINDSNGGMICIII
ncbi:stage IV sporulation protein A [Lachnotalea sp. AF33-28]|uniref:stage IV sporulation protein A n=1 Tax=Lachnotalea sp. AF33-28 TaxID=2292046 RepID=UPI000E49BE56|nr:stage IV sporulation protein A [Lachnotalea sp. AF33-28]RHP35758.1 stage IV sporulation protein A [Lachnotalea sp. AF33-28]